MLVQFASFCLEEGLPLADLGLRCVVTTSEVLGEGDRALISRAFGAPVYDEYGCGEVGAVLYECERGRRHLMAENLFVELADDATPDEPEAKRLVVTDLHNRATPLLRYDLGDRVVPAASCPCGRGLPAFERVFGRAYDFVEAPDGARFHGEFFLYSLEAARDRGLTIRQAQFVQTAPGEIEVRLVPGPGYDRADAHWLAERVASKSEGRFSVHAIEVGEISREASGKIRLIRRYPGASSESGEDPARSA
jgi:phenylacetate-CoA ligase